MAAQLLIVECRAVCQIISIIGAPVSTMEYVLSMILRSTKKNVSPSLLEMMFQLLPFGMPKYQTMENNSKKRRNLPQTFAGFVPFMYFCRVKREEDKFRFGILNVKQLFFNH